MPTPSSAELTRSTPFPDELGEPIWRERRTLPIDTVGGPIVAFLALGAIGVHGLALHLLLAVAAVAGLALLLRVRRRRVIETYTVTERFVAVVQSRGGRVAIPTEHLTGVTLAGDTVRLRSREGVVTLGFVRRQRALLRALERVAPSARVERDFTLFCPT